MLLQNVGTRLQICTVSHLII